MPISDCIIDDLCGLQFHVDPEAGATIGRRGDVVVGKENPYVSRHVLLVSPEGSQWLLQNIGRRTTVMVRYADDIRGIRIAPQQKFVLDSSDFFVYFAVKNEIYQVALRLAYDGEQGGAAIRSDGTETIDIGELSDRDRTLIVAFAEDYLNRRVESLAVLRSDGEVAERLGITEKSVQHRREALYRTLVGSGIVGDAEWRRIQPRFRILRAVEAAIESGLVTEEDLGLLGLYG